MHFGDPRRRRPSHVSVQVKINKTTKTGTYTCGPLPISCELHFREVPIAFRVGECRQKDHSRARALWNLHARAHFTHCYFYCTTPANKGWTLFKTTTLKVAALSTEQRLDDELSFVRGARRRQAEGENK